MKKMYSLNEIGLLPSSTPSQIKSRKDVYPYVIHINATPIKEKLPIFVAPMPCIIDVANYNTFDNGLVQPILPRGNELEVTVDYISKGRWVALSLKDFKTLFTERTDEEYIEAVNGGPNVMHVCIDMANGHMQELVDAIKTAKDIYGNNLIIMAGNIGHPGMYRELANAGADYVRVGIGGGNACTTSVLTGIHASLPWLIEECHKVRMAQPVGFRPKIVADGGIDTIDKAIKCLALGAGMVMMGKAFAKCREACGKTIEDISYSYTIDTGCHTESIIRREYYGNASAEGQKALMGVAKKPSEGISTYVTVDTCLSKFTSSFENALRSAMSYTNAQRLDEFIGKVEWRPMSQEEFKAYHKNYEG